jgi:sugar lactone lactonase YvrE
MRLGPYETHEVLGRGGMAVVYKGIQQSLGRVVAIKVLPKEFSRDRQFVGRFHREAESVAKLNHPNIIQIIDKGEDKGLCYFVMEYVKGSSLSAKLANKGVTFKELIEVAFQVCSALHYAHEQGVVHRDVKPANILIDEGTGVAKVADFGIAQLAEKSTAIGTLTGDHMAMGTLDYMAPEQKRDAKNVDRRADVFSVGVMLYEMATGRVPMGLFDPPSKLNKELPKDFDAVVMRCLRDKPDERFQSCLELANALSTLPQTASTMIRVITSVKSGVTNIGTQIGRRNPRYLAAVVFLVAGLGAGSWAVWTYGLKKKPAANGGSGAGSGEVKPAGNGEKPSDGNAVKPPDGETAEEKAFYEWMRAAAGLVKDRKLADARRIYEELEKTTTGPRRAELVVALDQLVKEEEHELAQEFISKLQEALAAAANADDFGVKALRDLYGHAQARRAPGYVITDIREALKDAEDARDEAAKTAAAAEKGLKFAAACRKAKVAIEGNDWEGADRELAEAQRNVVTELDRQELGRLTSLLTTRRNEAASAEQKLRLFSEKADAAAAALKSEDLETAKQRIDEAEGLVEGDAGRQTRVSELRSQLATQEKAVRFREKMKEAAAEERLSPERAARLYRDAAEEAPSEGAKQSALAKANAADAAVAQRLKDEEYARQMGTAKNAKEAGNWELVKEAAAKAEKARPGDRDARALIAEADVALAAKPPDPSKGLALKYRGTLDFAPASASSLAVGPDGMVWVADLKQRKIFRFDRNDKLVDSPFVPKEVLKPEKIAVAGGGKAWVSDLGTHKVFLVDFPAGTLVREIGGPGAEDGKFNTVTDLAVLRDGTLCVADYGNYRVQRFSADGRYLGKSGWRWGATNDRKGEFHTLQGIGATPDGVVYASDRGAKNIQRFRADGVFDGVFKSVPEYFPYDMTFARGRLYVTDTYLCRVVVYAPDGVQLTAIGTKGKVGAQFVSPQGIAVSELDGRVYVADPGLRRVIVLEEVP